MILLMQLFPPHKIFKKSFLNEIYDSSWLCITKKQLLILKWMTLSKASKKYEHQKIVTCVNIDFFTRGSKPLTLQLLMPGTH